MSLQRKPMMITDLDQSDEDRNKAKAAAAPVSSTQPKRQRKVLQTLSGNFSRRSRSVEVEQRQQPPPPSAGKKKPQQQERTLNALLQAKDEQLEQLLQRLAMLHKYNEQFAKENEQLRQQSTQLERRLAQTQQQLDSCASCEQLKQQLQLREEQRLELHNDVDMLKTLVFRLNVQIESYQDQRRSGEQQPEPAPSTVPEWSSGKLPTHTLMPLLQAYDESLRDKDSLLAQYAADFELFAGELKQALEENTRLLQSQEQLRRDVGNWAEERVRLQAQLGVCRSKAEAQTRKTDLAKEKLVEVMHFYEQRNQTLILDMNHLQDAYARCKAEVVAIKSMPTPEPSPKVAPAVTGQPSLESEAVQQCKQLLEELKQEHARERATQQEQLQTSQTRAASALRSAEKAKHARDRLKARLRMTLQWAQKLEAGQAEMRDTYDAVQHLSTLLKHKESQLRGLQSRNTEEVEKLRQKLEQKDETIKNLLRSKLERRSAVD
ncbi:CG8214 [Drosophila busckii]|uniref:CG8214 n=1 Tax=Drosophila busckii TaxID=30019 RepID=A0A0M5IXC1_DROBS|nr:protein Cep89 homolog [Drosophila busckii]ALC41174.1 CG8214 [Drosophila busckii]